MTDYKLAIKGTPIEPLEADLDNALHEIGLLMNYFKTQRMALARNMAQGKVVDDNNDVLTGLVKDKLSRQMDEAERLYGEILGKYAQIVPECVETPSIPTIHERLLEMMYPQDCDLLFELSDEEQQFLDAGYIIVTAFLIDELGENKAKIEFDKEKIEEWGGEARVVNSHNKYQSQKISLWRRRSERSEG